MYCDIKFEVSTIAVFQISITLDPTSEPQKRYGGLHFRRSIDIYYIEYIVQYSLPVEYFDLLLSIDMFKTELEVFNDSSFPRLFDADVLSCFSFTITNGASG